jgi:hypothetical protein
LQISKNRQYIKLIFSILLNLKHKKTMTFEIKIMVLSKYFVKPFWLKNLKSPPNTVLNPNIDGSANFHPAPRLNNIAYIVIMGIANITNFKEQVKKQRVPVQFSI